MPRLPRRPRASWPVSSMVWLAGPGCDLHPVLNHWCGCTLKPVFRPSTPRRTFRCWRVSNKGQWSCRRVWSTSVVRSGWGSWGFYLKKRTLTGNIITLYNGLKRRCSQVGVSLFSQIASNRTRGNGLQSCQQRFILDTRKKFLIEAVFRH